MNITKDFQPDKILQEVIDLSKRAGEAVLDVYSSYFTVEQKEDRSPLTLADKRSHEIISGHLRDRYPFPVLSEEGRSISYEERSRWDYFWLVDPLDGTKEFVKRNGEFTINVALIHGGRPIIGVIYIPVTKILYYGVNGRGSYRVADGERERLPVQAGKGRFTVVGSRSHATREFDEYVANIRERHGEIDFISAGSSIKFCLIAEGKADIYPRLGPTMEWDTAAGQIIVEESGGEVLEFGSGKPLTYNKENLLNPHFIASRKTIPL